MDNLTVIISVLVGFLIMKKVTGFIFRAIILLLLIGLIYYIYNGGDINSITTLIGMI